MGTALGGHLGRENRGTICRVEARRYTCRDLEEQEEWEQLLDAAVEERIAERSAGLKPGATHAEAEKTGSATIAAERSAGLNPALHVPRRKTQAVPPSQAELLDVTARLRTGPCVPALREAVKNDLPG